MTLDDFPLWSVWIRDYADPPAASREHWVLFVVEGHGPIERDEDDRHLDLQSNDDVVRCRVIATAIPLDTPSGTLAPGAPFDFSLSLGTFASLVRRVS